MLIRSKDHKGNAMNEPHVKLEYPWTIMDETCQYWDQSASKERSDDRLWAIINEDPKSKGHTIICVI